MKNFAFLQLVVVAAELLAFFGLNNKLIFLLLRELLLPQLLLLIGPHQSLAVKGAARAAATARPHATLVKFFISYLPFI